jgi:hypothetical protein
MNPTLRGFLIIALIALVVVALQLYQTLVAIGLLLRIAFFIAIAFVVYLLWRDRLRYEIETWSTRSRRVFYGGAALIVADLAVLFWPGRPALAGLDAIAFLGVLVLSALAMWRVWRDERSYGA